jgi:tetratricopeptide (TPR) repeat protein
MQVPNWVTPLADIEQLKAKPKEMLEAAAAVAEETLSRFDQDGAGAKDYLTTEGQYLASFGLLEAEDAPFFFKNLMDAGTGARKRLARFARISLDDQSLKHAWELQYCWARALLDIPARRQAVERISAIDGSPAKMAGPAEPPAVTERLRDEAGKLLEAGAPDQALQRLRELTKELITKGDLPGATTVLERLYRSKPQSFSAEDHFLYGAGLLFVEDYAKAEGHFQEAIKRGIDKRLEPWAFANGAACLIELKKFEEAEQMVQKLEKAHSDSLELALTSLQLGKALALAKDYPKARGLLQKIAGQKGGISSIREEAKALLKTIESETPDR